MISQIDIEKILHLHSKSNQFQFQADCRFVSLATVINELCDIINAIVVDVDGTKCVDGSKAPADNSEKANCQENVQPDYVATAYMTDGHTKKYYGQNGASIVTDRPLPAGYVIAINEPETKGGDNE